MGKLAMLKTKLRRGRGILASAVLLTLSSAYADETQTLKVDGLDSGGAAWGLAFRGCPVQSVKADGVELKRNKDGAFLNEKGKAIPADARLEVELARSCERVEVSELKVDQLSRGEEGDLPPTPASPDETASQAPARGPGAEANPPTPSLPAQPGQQTESRPNMVVNIPGRVVQDSHLQNITGSRVGGDVRRRTQINGNIGVETRVRQRAPSLSRSTIHLEKADTRISGKGAGTDAYAGHSQVGSFNQGISGNTVGGNVDTELVISGNIGGSVDYESNDGATEERNITLTGPRPAPIVKNYHTTNVTQQPVITQWVTPAPAPVVYWHQPTQWFFGRRR